VLLVCVTALAWWFTGRPDTATAPPPAAEHRAGTAGTTPGDADQAAGLPITAEEELLQRLDPKGLLSGSAPSAEAPESAADGGGTPRSLRHDSPRGSFVAQLPDGFGEVIRAGRLLDEQGEHTQYTDHRVNALDDSGSVQLLMLAHYDVSPSTGAGSERQPWMASQAREALEFLQRLNLDSELVVVDGQEWYQANFDGDWGGEAVYGQLRAARFTEQDVVMLHAIGHDPALSRTPEVARFLSSVEFIPAATSIASASSCSYQPSASATVQEVDRSGIAPRLRRARGCHVLVEIWATNCPPCRGVLPQLDTLAQHYGPSGLVIQAFSTDERADDLRALLRRQPASYEPLWLRPGSQAALRKSVEAFGGSYAGESPYFALLDDSGSVLVEGTGAGALDAVEAELQRRMP